MEKIQEEVRSVVLGVGDTLPNIEFEYFQDESFRKMKFSDLRGKWVVVMFYPADFTFVCPTELEELADRYEKFKTLGAEVLSFSTDTVFVHKAWHDHSNAIKKITFPMGADPTGKISRLFNVYLENEGLALRGTFVIDPDGVMQTSEIHSNNIGRSADEALRKLEAAIFVREHPGQVCPANWQKGKETLKPGVELVGKI